MNLMPGKKGILVVEKYNQKRHLPQTSSEKTSDLFFILSSLYSVESHDKSLTKLTLLKSLFRASIDQAEKGKSFLNTFFYVYSLGPFNKVIYKYLEELENADLIEVDGKNINLTAKGARVTSELLEQVSENTDLINILELLKKYAEKYVANPKLAVDESHSQRVIDRTDNDKIKSIDQLAREVKSKETFLSEDEFKYINPFATNQSGIEKIMPSSRTINELEKVLSKVEPQDFEKEGDLSLLFA